MADARIEAGEQGWRYFAGLYRLLLRLACCATRRTSARSPGPGVYWAGEELPPYHRTALGGAALLWRTAER